MSSGAYTAAVRDDEAIDDGVLRGVVVDDVIISRRMESRATDAIAIPIRCEMLLLPVVWEWRGNPPPTEEELIVTIYHDEVGG